MFDDIIADMEYIKIKSCCYFIVFKRKLNILLDCIPQSDLKVPKTVRPNATHHFFLKILNHRELQQIASNHLSDIDFKDLMKLYEDYTKEPDSFLVNYMTLSSDNPLRLRKNIL